MPALIVAGIGAATSIIGGIVGSSQAAEQNKQAEENYNNQKKAQENLANVTNAYNKKAFEVDKLNYYNQREYEYDIALRNWRYQTEVQDYQYLAAMKQYGKSVENTDNQLAYNSIAAVRAYEGEQQALNDIYTEDAFSRQGLLVDQLQNEGRASLGQAGNTRGKALQSSIAALGRNSAIMDASLSSSVEQSQRNLNQIGLQRYAADLNAKASMMIRPERPPEVLKPIQAPERIFIEPMKAIPGAVQAPYMQSTSAPLISGLLSAATSVAGGIAGNSMNNYQSPPIGGGGGFGTFGNYSGLSGNPYFK